MFRPTGAYTAIVTPMTAEGHVDEAGLRRLVDFQIEGRIDGLVAVGTTGESATLSKEEHLRVVQVVIEQAAGRVPVIAGVGSNDTRVTLAMTRAALELGADAGLVVVPYYNKPSQEGMFRHFSAVADVGLPVMLYNVPGRTVVSISAQTVGRLAPHPNIVAIKEASANMSLGTAILEAAGDHITHLSGDDFTTFPYVAIGGHGCVSVVSNIAPGLMHDLVDAASKGDLEKARPLHQKATRLARLCFSDSNPAPTKHMLSLMGICGADLRLPLAPIEPELAAKLEQGLREEGLLS